MRPIVDDGRPAPPAGFLHAGPVDSRAGRSGGVHGARIPTRADDARAGAPCAAPPGGDPSAVPVLAKLLQDPETIVRGHAAWALQQIDDPRARAAIANALAGEQDSQVKQELAG